MNENGEYSANFYIDSTMQMTNNVSENFFSQLKRHINGNV